MQRLSVYTLSLGLFLVTACAKTAPWPAAVVQWDGFSDSEKYTTRAVLQDLESRSGEKWLAEDGVSSGRYELRFKKQSFTGADETNRAGYATEYPTYCLVELSPSLFTESKRSTLVTVVAHELGHCAGLVHLPTQGEIMFTSVKATTLYPDEAWNRFFKSFLGSMVRDR